MSNKEVKDSNYYIDWLEKSIANEYLSYYEYSEFKNIKKIGNGSFGSVSRANWKNTDTILVLKSFNNSNPTLKEIVNELKLHRDVHFNANIIKFYGITKTETENYALVLEYADNATLKTYLNENFNELEWKDKFCLALQLTDAILCLHERDIIHRDLNVGNMNQMNVQIYMNFFLPLN
ncbi:kinase-like protein [Rhizophagus irregularis]|uniref:Kinase-like protein n=1 Tax=Rhizophagus irregularis TaxID=588596 RepID=A0A2N0PPL6_9GLOM|nr:kinase-like protein [Rhizophagus irregularis]